MTSRLQNLIYLLLLGMAYILGVATSSAQETSRPEFLWHDPTKIVTAVPCGECHQMEYGVWKETKHSTTFKTLHRKDLAERITKKMGFKLIKRESLCLKCHYTGAVKNGQLRAISGVSCESCHGAARDWINVHNNYGPGTNYGNESAEHKTQRVNDSKQKGMLRPSEIYDVVANCFQCHTVPHEKLVNVGSHPTGSSDFSLLKRIDEIRHNFLQAQFDPSRSENEERLPERERVLFVVGHAVDLEFSIRGAAVAKETGSYIRAMQRRVRSAFSNLDAIQRRVAIEEVKNMLSLLGDVNTGPNNESTLLAAAAKISEATKTFIRNNNGSALAALDGVISGTENLFAVETNAKTEESESAVSKERDLAAEEVSKSNNEDRAGSARESAAPIYAKKKYLRPRSKFKTILSGCNCHTHTDQIKWWEKDKHYASAEPFWDRAQKNIQIARIYGISDSDMTRGEYLCMDCHGTVISNDPFGEVYDGVSCESCHGPAGEYEKPHQVEGKAYSEGKKYGMVQLEDVAVRAEACAQCHYISDPRLISAGHPTGKTFDFEQRNQQIRQNQQFVHWKNPIARTDELRTAYVETKRKRGAIPEVEIVSPEWASTATGQVRDEEKSITILPPVPRPGVIQPRQFPGQKSDELPPFPEISDGTPVEEILLILKKRIELLHERIRQRQ